MPVSINDKAPKNSDLMAFFDRFHLIFIPFSGDLIYLPNKALKKERELIIF